MLRRLEELTKKGRETHGSHCRDYQVQRLPGGWRVHSSNLRSSPVPLWNPSDLDREMLDFIIVYPLTKSQNKPQAEYPALHLRHFCVSTVAKENTFFFLLLCILANILSKELCSKNSGNTCQQKTWELCLNKRTCQLSRTVDYAGLKNADYFKTSLMDNRNWVVVMQHGMCLEWRLPSLI